MIIKRGPFESSGRRVWNPDKGDRRLGVKSFMLSHLVYWLFHNESLPLPQSLRDFWVQDFDLIRHDWAPISTFTKALKA